MGIDPRPGRPQSPSCILFLDPNASMFLRYGLRDSIQIFRSFLVQELIPDKDYCNGLVAQIGEPQRRLRSSLSGLDSRTKKLPKIWILLSSP